MATLVAITFEDQESASDVLRRVRQIERGGPDPPGRHRHPGQRSRRKDPRQERARQCSRDGREVVGGFLGLHSASCFPVAGLVAGIAGGALVGRMFEQGVDKELVKEVREQLKPGTSALFLMVQSGSPDAAIAAVRPHKGKVYQSALSYETEQSLRRALGERV